MAIKTLKQSDIINILSKKSSDLIAEFEDLLQNSLSEVPLLDEIKNNIDVRYESYAEVANRCRKTSEILSNAYFTRDAAKRLKANLNRDQTSSKAVLSAYFKDLDQIYSDTNDLIEAVKSDKEGCDQLLKFYNSVQYMFGAILDVKSAY